MAKDMKKGSWLNARACFLCFPAIFMRLDSLIPYNTPDLVLSLYKDTVESG